MIPLTANQQQNIGMRKTGRARTNLKELIINVHPSSILVQKFIIKSIAPLKYAILFVLDRFFYLFLKCAIYVAKP